MEVAKALGGSFKLVTSSPKPVRVREMTQLLRKHKRMGTHKQIKAIQTHKIQTSAQPAAAAAAVIITEEVHSFT